MPLMLKRIRSTRTPRQKAWALVVRKQRWGCNRQCDGSALTSDLSSAGVRVKADILFPNAAANTQIKRSYAKSAGGRCSVAVHVAREPDYWAT
jgi:hypothetical protein